MGLQPQEHAEYASPNAANAALATRLPERMLASTGEGIFRIDLNGAGTLCEVRCQ